MTTRRQLIIGLPGAGIALAVASHAAAQPAMVEVEQAPDLPAGNFTTFEEVSPGLLCDLGEVPLEDALLAIDERHGRRRWEYTIVVAPSQSIYAKRMLRMISARIHDMEGANSLIAPHFNLRIEDFDVRDKDGRKNEGWWYVEAVDRTSEVGYVAMVGSLGCGGY